MGMMSRAMKKRKKEMDEELDRVVESTKGLSVIYVVELEREIAEKLHTIANERGIDVKRLVNTRMATLVNAFERERILRLTDSMPYGQYKGINIEDMIRSDPRYVNYLVSVSDIFVLDVEATELLGSLS